MARNLARLPVSNLVARAGLSTATAPAANPDTAYLLRLYRHTLREINTQFTKVNQNTAWKEELRRQYSRPSALLPSSVSSRTSSAAQISERNAEDLLTFLRANRTHREMMERYWPGERMNEAERVEASANRVGLTLPKMFRDLDED